MLLPCPPFVRAASSCAALVLLAALVPALAQQQASSTTAQVRLLASNCANCHGTDGHSQGGMPSLSGQSKSALADMLKAFRDGTRPATVMQQLAKGYTDAEIDALAAYFAAQKN